MDFKSLLQSMTKLSEAEGKVHKGTYGTSHGKEDVRDQYGHKVGKIDKDADSKKDAPKKGRGRPKKGADDSGEVKQYDTKTLGSVFGGGQKPKKEVGKVSKKHSLKEYIEEAEVAIQEGMTSQDPVQIKPASQTNTQVIQQGNKTLGTVTNPQLAAQIKQSIGKGEMTLNPDEEMQEGKDQGKPGKNFAKIAKSAGAHYGSKAAGERVAGAVKAKLAAQGKLEEAKPDFLDVDKDNNKKESWKKAEKDKAKKKVSESIILEGAMKDLMMRLIDDLNAGGQGYNIKPAVDLQDRQLATRVIDKTLAHDDRYRRLSHTLKSQLRDAALEEFGFTDFESSLEEADTLPAVSSKVAHTQHGLDAKPSKFVAVDPNPPKTPWKIDPIERSTQEIGAGARKAFDFIRGTKKESTFEGKDMKDIQVEGWEKQLNSLLTEGITVSSSTGQEGSPDSVTISATDADAGQLLGVLRNAGIGVFGSDEQPEIGYGVAQGGEEDFDGTGTEPQPSPNVVGDGDDMLSMMKKMAGIETGASMGGEEGGQDYEDEEGAEEQTLEPADGGEEEQDSGEESDEESSEEEGSEEADDEEEQTDEGNAFTGKLKQTPQGGNFKMGDKSYKDTSSIEEEHDHKTCNECGGTMYEGHSCGEEQVEENFSNDAGGNASSDTELMKLKALLAMGGDMHKQKRDQTVGNPTQVSMAESLADWKKLSGIK